MRTPEIRGVLFDKDGTLFDFRATWGGYLRAVLGALAPDGARAEAMARAVGFDPEAMAFADPMSPVVVGPLDEIGRIWAPFLPGRRAEELTAWIDAHAARWVAEGDGLVPAAPEMDALLGRLGAIGPLGVATNDSRRAAETQLARIGVAARFAHLFGYDSVPRPKPAPDMILAFAEAVGLAPAEIAMVGDSRHDLDAARAAGVGMSVAVLTGVAVEADLAPHADAVIPSIADLPRLLGRRPARG